MNKYLVSRLHHYTVDFSKFDIDLVFSGNFQAYNVTKTDIVNKIIPIPKCKVTRCAWRRSIITNAPKVICEITADPAISEAIFIPLGDS